MRHECICHDASCIVQEMFIWKTLIIWCTSLDTIDSIAMLIARLPFSLREGHHYALSAPSDISERQCGKFLQFFQLSRDFLAVMLWHAVKTAGQIHRYDLTVAGADNHRISHALPGSCQSRTA